jgi:hypothetical protein
MVFPGRFTAQYDESFVVYLIGMRINRVLNLLWIRVACAMPPMIAELKRHPTLGMLHAEFFLYWRGVAVVQYWRSFERLRAYALARETKHLPAWAEFNRRIGGDASVGVWHETYAVLQGQLECIYANMTLFGMAQATRHQAVTGRLDGARLRIGQSQ